MDGSAPMVAVASGKGGVGKSTVAVNLALALRDQGRKVGLVDADLHGPNIPRLLNLTRQREAASLTLWTSPDSGESRLRPYEHLGIGVISTQFLLGERQAFAVGASYGSLLLRRLLHGVDWGDTDVLVVDLPPGTGDVLQQLAEMGTIAAAIVVVTPQDVAHLDAKKLLTALRTAGVTVLGGVENMASFACPDCGASVAAFPATPPERSIWHDGTPRLAAIPLAPLLAEAESSGVPVVESHPTSEPGQQFARLARAVLPRL